MASDIYCLSFAFSHGANDIANAIGPFAAILDVLKTGEINSKAPVPSIAMLTFGISLVVGLWFLGKEVIKTVGGRLAEIFPVTGFSAELGASAVILLATKMGIPVSSNPYINRCSLRNRNTKQRCKLVINETYCHGLDSNFACSWYIFSIFFFILKAVMGL